MGTRLYNGTVPRVKAWGDGDIALEKYGCWSDEFDIGMNTFCATKLISSQFQVVAKSRSNGIWRVILALRGTVRVAKSAPQNGLGMRMVERAISSSISKPNNFL